MTRGPAREAGEPPEPGLRRRLGVPDAVVVGLGSMLGAGIFAVLAPASAAAGSGLLWGLAAAAVVAYCNAASSARLAAVHPSAGGAYVYGRERLGELWGYLAGCGFVVGKTASCAAMALTVGSYAWPGQAHVVACAAVVAVTAVNFAGIEKSAWFVRAVVAVVLAVLAALCTACAVSLTSDGGAAATGLGAGAAPGAGGVLQAAGLLFFAFAGYARITTLGEEVRDPARTIPRAVPIALGIALLGYAAVSLSALSVLGPQRLAAGAAPLTAAAEATGVPGLGAAVRVAAVVAALGALLALLLGVSRTVLAMARDRHLPGALAAVHPRFAVPHRAELLVGAVVAVVAATADVRGAIGFSSFAVLVYYAIANAAALTLDGERRRLHRATAAAGLAGCLTLAAALPWSSVAAGGAAFAVFAALYGVRRAVTAARR